MGPLVIPRLPMALPSAHIPAIAVDRSREARASPLQALPRPSLILVAQVFYLVHHASPHPQYQPLLFTPVALAY